MKLTASERAVPFAWDGRLKMLYDNRMHPQAFLYEDKVYIVWRGDKGMPYIRSYDLKTRTFSDPVMVLSGLEDKVELDRYYRDHHFAPVIWMDTKCHFHVLSGCHGNKPHNYTGGHRVMSKSPGDITAWEWVEDKINFTVNYPQVYRIYNDQTLIYLRNGGHLSEWTYRISADDGATWAGPCRAVVDLDAEPQDGYIPDHAGSYHAIRIGKDGKTLHIGFIWAQQDYEPPEKPPVNPRYGELDRFHRYNLYYAKVDLPTGTVTNFAGKKLHTPIRKSIADADCLVWDTKGRISPMGPSIYLDENDTPYFLLAVSDETPYQSTFYLIKNTDGAWRKTPITKTPHPFNNGHLERNSDGSFSAYMIAGASESISHVSKQDMGRYGWGDRVEWWTSDTEGENWRLTQDLTPALGKKWQNVKFVSDGKGETIPGLLLFYGWEEIEGPGTAYLWDNRERKKIIESD